MKRLFWSMAIALLIIVVYSPVYAQSSGYHVLHTFHIKSEGRWDYIAVNPVNGHIYVSHSEQVNVLNNNTGDSVGVIPNTSGVHGIAFSARFKKGFTSNGKINTVTVFDITTNATLAQIKPAKTLTQLCMIHTLKK